MLVLALISNTQGEYYGKLISSDWGDSASVHELAGSVYAVDDNTIQIIGFNFDGNAPGKPTLLYTSF